MFPLPLTLQGVGERRYVTYVQPPSPPVHTGQRQIAGIYTPPNTGVGVGVNFQLENTRRLDRPLISSSLALRDESFPHNPRQEMENWFLNKKNRLNQEPSLADIFLIRW